MTLMADHLSRLASRHILAGAYGAYGHVKKAVELFESGVSLKTRVLRVDHPSLLISVNALANMHAELAFE